MKVGEHMQYSGNVGCRTLFESWETDEKIGEGSFGVVYKVTKREMGETYDSAVKVITVPTREQYREVESSFSGDKAAITEYFEDIVKNIVREIKILYSLGGNTNIIGYQDHKVIKKENEASWEILIRMEYVTSLRKYLLDHSLTLENVVRLGIDICTALETCSKIGIVHRDIKDDNIFVTDQGVFKLGDFGIARELSKSGRAASMRGTPLYMAPEIYRGEKYDAAVDIYSLGIVMYKLLNHGRMPFMPPYPDKMRYQDSEDSLEKRLSGAALPAPMQAEGSLAGIILKACAYCVADRYQTPSEMKSALSKYLADTYRSERQQVVMGYTDMSRYDAAFSQEHRQEFETQYVFSYERSEKGTNEATTADRYQQAMSTQSAFGEIEDGSELNTGQDAIDPIVGFHTNYTKNSDKCDLNDASESLTGQDDVNPIRDFHTHYTPNKDESDLNSFSGLHYGQDFVDSTRDFHTDYIRSSDEEDISPTNAETFVRPIKTETRQVRNNEKENSSVGWMLSLFIAISLAALILFSVGMNS
jgi:serine/threonine protein kinase